MYDPWLMDGVNCHNAKDTADFVKKLSYLLEKGDSPSILGAGYEVAQARNLNDIGERLKEAYSSLLMKKH